MAAKAHPPSQQITFSPANREVCISHHFPVGSAVEIRSDKAYFKDTHFSGKVISYYLENKKVIVEYNNLFKDDDGLDPVTEEIDIKCLRPFPAPQEIVDGLEPGDIVDAFYNEDWWIGVVSKVVDEEEKRYIITFQNPSEVLEFALSDLRVHWDWTNGRWFRPHKKTITGHMFDVASEVEVAVLGGQRTGAWYRGMIKEYLEDRTYFLVKYLDDPTDPTRIERVNSIHIRPCPPIMKNKKFVLLENIEAFFNYGWWSGVIKEELADDKYIVFFKRFNMEREYNHSDLRSQIDWINGYWTTYSQRKIMERDENNIEILRIGNLNRVDPPVSPALQADIPDFPADSSAEKPKQSEIVEYSEKRKRGRPRKFSVETSQNVAASGIDMETSPLPIQVKALNKDIAFSGGSDIRERKRTPTKKREGMLVEEPINPQDNNMPKKGRKHNTYLRIQDLIGASGGKSVEVNPTLEVNIVCDAPSLNIENQPLSKCVEGKLNPAVDISDPSPVNGVEQPIEIGEKNQGDTGVFEESEVPIPMMDEHPLAQGLPFVKSSILWKTLEAMDPFQRIPQNPHFQPLQNITEGLREGEAIGYMVTFAGVVEKVYGLQFGDPKSVTDNILEALAELEKQGFNVKPIRSRVSELLAVKEKEAILTGDVKEINGRIIEHRQQKDKVEGEIQGLKKELQKMEQWLAVLESAKEKEEGEAAAAVHRLKKIEESIVDVKREFEGIVSSAF